MQIKVNDIAININKKAIKNLHLYVKPPEGRVEVSAPLEMSTQAIELFVRVNLTWIKHQIIKYEGQERATKRQYVTGETIYIWGKQYFLEFIPSSRNSFTISGNKIILSMRDASSVKSRELYVREELRKVLIDQVNQLLPKWIEKTGFIPKDWQTKYMISKWGTCNPQTKKIWLNLQLVYKPIPCLEYVILHELVHLKVKNHNEDFIFFMDKYMTNWREIRNELNTLRLDYMEKKFDDI